MEWVELFKFLVEMAFVRKKKNNVLAIDKITCRKNNLENDSSQK